MDLLELTVLQRRIFRELCKSTGEPLSKAELARRANATPAGIGKALKGLDELVSYDERHAMVLVSLARTRVVRSLKRVENLAMLFGSGLVEELERTQPGSTVILFGSFAFGEDTIRSDIDLAIIGPLRELPDLTGFENVLRRPINVERIEHLGNVAGSLRENLYSGIVLFRGVCMWTDSKNTSSPGSS